MWCSQGHVLSDQLLQPTLEDVKERVCVILTEGNKYKKMPGALVGHDPGTDAIAAEVKQFNTLGTSLYGMQQNYRLLLVIGMILTLATLVAVNWWNMEDAGYLQLLQRTWSQRPLQAWIYSLEWAALHLCNETIATLDQALVGVSILI